MEIRNGDGAVVGEHALSNEVYHHPTRDLACLHFQDEFATLVEMAEAGEEQIFEPLQLAGLESQHTSVFVTLINCRWMHS